MVSLQYSDAVPVDLFPPPLDVLLFPPLSVTFGILSCSKTQLAMQVPAEKKKRGLPHRLDVTFHNGLHRGADVRMYVRRTNPK